MEDASREGKKRRKIDGGDRYFGVWVVVWFVDDGGCDLLLVRCGEAEELMLGFWRQGSRGVLAEKGESLRTRRRQLWLLTENVVQQREWWSSTLLLLCYVLF